jgi:hypothetical protein
MAHECSAISGAVLAGKKNSGGTPAVSASTMAVTNADPTFQLWGSVIRRP